MKILITDHHCASQRGDSAIFEGTLYSLKKYFPCADFILMTDYPEAGAIMHDIKAFRQPFTFFRWSNFKKGLKMIYLLIGSWLYNHGIIIPKFKDSSVLPYLEADIVISKGGSFISDYYTPTILGRLWSLYFAKSLGKSVFIYAQSIGPLNKSFYRWIARYVFNRVDLITLRDYKSKEVLTSIKVTKPPIYVTADAAFCMPSNGPKPLQTRRYECISFQNTSTLRISISARKWDYYTTPKGHRNYIKTMAALVDWLILEKNAQVFFISTCTGFNGYNKDDRIVAHEIINNMEHSEEKNPSIICGEYTPQELVEIYKVMDLHIGTRMHSIILAMLAKTPVVAIQYEFKTQELMKLFLLQDYFVDINHIKLKNLKEKVDKALINREQLKNQINSKLPEIKMNSECSAELIFNMVKGKGVNKL